MRDIYADEAYRPDSQVMSQLFKLQRFGHETFSQKMLSAKVVRIGRHQLIRNGFFRTSALVDPQHSYSHPASLLSL